MSRFEGSFLGDAAKVGDGAIVECKICWHVYDPALGDEMRQIPPGTPFSALPPDWRCPACDGAHDQFMVLDAGSGPSVAVPKASPSLDMLAIIKAQKLTQTFASIYQNKMRDTPFINRSLSVEAVGFRPWQGRILGILITPWFMNLMVMPGTEEHWQDFRIGEKRLFSFASGDYEFIYNIRKPVGPYFSCVLFSLMAEFSSQLQATDTARAAMGALFDEAHREDGDHSAVREAELEAAREKRIQSLSGEPTRRSFMTGGLTGLPEDAAG